MGIKNNIESFDNNQLLARYILSFTVFISHSLYIYGKVEPSFYEGGHSLGWYAVNGFFFISGVLIAHSFQRRNFIEYISARVLRLFPAFILSLVVSIIAVVIFDKVNINSTFIISAAKFIFGNIVPIQEIKGGGISGIWSNGAAPGVLNTSLWTIPFEFFCYIFIVPLALSGKKYPFSRVLIGIVGIYFLSNLGVISGDGIIRYDFLRVFAYFLLGVGFYKCIFNKDGAIVIVLGLILILFFEGDFLEFGISLSLVLLIAFFGFSKKNFIKYLPSKK